MELSQIDLDRNINRLRIHAIDFADITNEELISLLEKTVENIQGIAYYWATLSAEKKQILPINVQTHITNKQLFSENKQKQIIIYSSQ